MRERKLSMWNLSPWSVSTTFVSFDHLVSIPQQEKEQQLVGREQEVENRKREQQKLLDDVIKRRASLQAEVDNKQQQLEVVP